jgi:hypothetical protein
VDVEMVIRYLNGLGWVDRGKEERATRGRGRVCFRIQGVNRTSTGWRYLHATCNYKTS